MPTFVKFSTAVVDIERVFGVDVYSGSTRLMINSYEKQFINVSETVDQVFQILKNNAGGNVPTFVKFSNCLVSVRDVFGVDKYSGSTRIMLDSHEKQFVIVSETISQVFTILKNNS